jgi:MoaA/NifB/PqqE/SkfB family radical SAM enzyme
MSSFDFINPPERLQTLIVETTTLCSLHCAGCGRTVDKALGRWTDRHMSAARFKTIVDHSPPADAICVQGIGEPTLNPEFPEIVSIAKQSGKFGQIIFSTHGLAKNAEYYRKLVVLGLSHFRVSVDSIDQETADLLRRGTDVAKLLRRIRAFADLRLSFGITITVSKKNIGQIPDMLEAFNAIAENHRFTVGMHNFIYRLDEQKPGAPDYTSWVLDYSDIQTIERDMPHWRKRFPNIDLSYVPYYQGDGAVGTCDTPRTEPWIGVDGTWGVCCYYIDPAVLGHTSIETMPFDQAWRSEKAQTFFERYASESPTFCDHCPKNCGRLSPSAASTATGEMASTAGANLGGQGTGRDTQRKKKRWLWA